jgi:hypothetical protein
MRVRAAIAAELLGEDGSRTAARILDVSLVGMLANVAGGLEIGRRFRVEFEAGERSASLAGWDARATVVRSSRVEVALRFDELPYECYQELRVLLLRNSGDPSRMDEELTDRLGFLGEEH